MFGVFLSFLAVLGAEGARYGGEDRERKTEKKERIK